MGRNNRTRSARKTYDEKEIRRAEFLNKQEKHKQLGDKRDRKQSGK